MNRQLARPVALAIIWRGEELLVGPVVELDGTVIGRRPPGGTIKFGEPGADAVRREVDEELGAEIADVRYLATLENRFTFRRERGHELVRLYEARFADEAFYRHDVIDAVEASGDPFTCEWWPLELFEGAERLYPDGLLELLRGRLLAPPGSRLT